MVKNSSQWAQAVRLRSRHPGADDREQPGRSAPPAHRSGSTRIPRADARPNDRPSKRCRTAGRPARADDPTSAHAKTGHSACDRTGLDQLGNALGADEPSSVSTSRLCSPTSGAPRSTRGGRGGEPVRETRRLDVALGRMVVLDERAVVRDLRIIHQVLVAVDRAGPDARRPAVARASTAWCS